MKRLWILLLLPLVLTGCGSEGFADRMYTRAIGLHGDLQMSVQGFEQDGCTVVEAGSIRERQGLCRTHGAALSGRQLQRGSGRAVVFRAGHLTGLQGIVHPSGHVSAEARCSGDGAFHPHGRA